MCIRDSSELLRTYTEAATRAQQEMQKSQVDRQGRSKQLDAALQRFELLDGALAKATS